MTVVGATHATNQDTLPHDSSSQSRQNDEERKATAQAWAYAFHQLRGDSVDSPEEREADKERIACLEAIITVLIEKNERMRQQLMDSWR